MTDECRKCGQIDPDGMYSVAIGSWLCEKHFEQLEDLIKDFMENGDA